ncbi:hypothetical protein AGABI1DRAFT_114341 [Agaricus bisporus var. burnettii JB137-S8]|uniref:INO80 complex subunit B-like conserved region domain-containing protein n=1 Tax=Agaricus bisporus var. burnettii (strain JB137-S8 / ATCC MYA-4627 / FGSC 10392) TaxID=597362 RepID=K5VW84_AGABU|nr:uncharacterized protein AGABI1DRAFT_114341 [Agaricus bisporus var. burnettii JB137-S8]EKM78739.1 hypothetical protein AGABI1DRAFT_114341 [Agaricus bisporus var. burnettii JB137-S8]
MSFDRSQLSFISVEEDASNNADLQIDSDVDMEQDDDIDVENDDEVDNDDEGEEADEEEEEEERDDIQSEDEDEEEELIPSPRKSQPRLKIKLKFGSSKRITSSSDSTAQPTPEVETPPPRVRGRKKVRSDIESEDSMSPESEDDQADSASGSRLPGQAKPMTTRQAVLASMVDSSHVSLGENNRGKKKTLNESELALRREETARKRKSVTEKKLEDEKAETINRLLKKQSRPRNKRGTALDDRSPMPSSTGKKLKQKVKDEEREDAAEEREEEEAMEVVAEEVRPPVLYRWISSTQGSGDSAKMVLSFSVPPTALPASPHELEIRQLKTPSNCAVEGCSQPRKYRLVKDWAIGACGMTHLKFLEEH